MRRQAEYITARELAAALPEIPKVLRSGEQLIYSSPATLSYNSPGAQGFGVKRAGLVIPESVMLLVAPTCCGRNTTILGDEGGYSDRMFYLEMDETDLVTGRHLTAIPEAIREILTVAEPRPRVVVICITCVDALLGTDLERVCRRAEAETGVHVVPSYMYALTREGKNPPMVAIRETIYSLLERQPADSRRINLLGHFSPLEADCELYALLPQLGWTEIREVSRCRTLEEYQQMGAASCNLILHPEARKAAYGLERRLGIPYAELTRLYDIERIARQYALFAAALGAKLDDAVYYEEAAAAVRAFRTRFAGRRFAVGQVLNAHPIEMALALARMDIEVSAVFANVSADDAPWIRELAACAPEARIYAPLVPSMLHYRGEERPEIAIGLDTAYYYPEAVCVPWHGEAQPFGYRGLVHFLAAVTAAATAGGR